MGKGSPRRVDNFAGILLGVILYKSSHPLDGGGWGGGVEIFIDLSRFFFLMG